jgi:3-isopropylmalate/(R)-2-methylmalate dehydratase small subunit
MARFDTLTAVAAPLVIDNLDTDQIFPARFSSRNRNDGQFGTYFLHDHRFDETGQARAGFILNDARLAGTRILVASENYACGSGRAGAIFSHVDYGIRAIIAESFGSVFSAVAYKSGLLTIPLARDEIRFLQDRLLQNLGSPITIDLPGQVILVPGAAPIRFEIDHFVKRLIMDGLREIELTLGLEPEIAAFESRQRALLPWVFGPGHNVTDRQPESVA